MSLSSSESDRFSTSGEEGPLGDHVAGLHEQHVLRVGEVRDVYELIGDLFDMAGANSSRSAARPNQSPPAIHEAQGRRKAREKNETRRGR